MTEDAEESFEGAITRFLEQPEGAYTQEECRAFMERLFHTHGVTACDFFVQEVVANSSPSEQICLIYGYVTFLADDGQVNNAIDWANEFITAQYEDSWEGATNAFYALILIATHVKVLALSVGCLTLARQTAWMIKDDIERMRAFLGLFELAGKLEQPEHRDDYRVALDIQMQAKKRGDYAVIAHFCLAAGAFHANAELFQQALAAAQKVTNLLAKADLEHYIERLVTEGHVELLRVLIRDKTRTRLHELAQRTLDAHVQKRRRN